MPIRDASDAENVEDAPVPPSLSQDTTPPTDDETADPAPPAKNRRARFWLVVIVIAGATILFSALKPSLGSLRSLLPALRQIQIVWVLAGIAAQALMYGCVAGIVRAGLRASLADRAEGDDTPVALPGGINMFGAAAAFLWTNRAFPGPAVAGLATLVFLLGRRGISAATSQAAAATFYLADYVGFVAISFVVLVLLAISGHLGSLHPVMLCIAMLCITASMIATIILLRSPRLVGNLAESVAGRGARWLRRPDPPSVARWARETVDGFYLRWRSISAHPTALISACLWAVLMHLSEVATVFCSILAFCPAASLRQAGGFAVASSAGFVAGNLAAIVSFLPAGIGFFETAMGISLHVLGGLTPEQAALATILFRFLAVWLPVPFVLRTARYAVMTVARSLRTNPKKSAPGAAQ